MLRPVYEEWVILVSVQDGVKFHAFLLTTGTTGNANPGHGANDEHEEIPRQPSQENFGQS